MIGLKDIVVLLERWDTWKEISATPARIEELEARISALEERFKKAPGRVCPSCGQPDLRAVGQPREKRLGGILAATERDLKCSSCGWEEKETVYPK